MTKIVVIVEKANEGYLGRMQYKDDLLLDEADTLEALGKSLLTLLKNNYGIDTEKMQIELEYELSAFFAQFSYLKITNVAEKVGINASLLRAYASGIKHASAAQAQKIEDTIHHLGKELLAAQVYGKESTQTST